MSRILVNQTGVTAPTVDYPNGYIEDDKALIGEGVNGDIIQFFQKLLIDAGTTVNDLPDNVTNGYQLILALSNKIQGLVTEDNPWAYLDDIHLLNGWINSGGTVNRVRYRVLKNGFAQIIAPLTCAASITNGIFYRLPTALIPTGGASRYGTFINVNAGGSAYLDTGKWRINSSGDIIIEELQYISAGALTSNYPNGDIFMTALYPLD